jgi:two-component system chemotaxis response regulator CheB
MESPLRVLIVDDTVTYRKIVSDVLAGCPGVEVVGTAANGRIALQRLDQQSADLLVLDLEMPEMNGQAVLEELRRRKSPAGAIMLSAFTAQGAKATLAALETGAFDFVLKPSGANTEANVEHLRRELWSKLGAYARHRSVRQILYGGNEKPPSPDQPSGAARRGAGGEGGLQPQTAPAPRLRPVSDRAAPATEGLLPNGETFGRMFRRGRETLAEPAALAPATPVPRPGSPQVVALGISTGGPKALAEMVPQLPAHLPVPLLIVQHMPPVFTSSLADDLNNRTPLAVREGLDGQPIRGGEVWIAPGGRQMKVQRENGQVVLRITDDPPENSCRPSVDYLFRSVADVYGGRAVGVIMTGMGNDGALGCRRLKHCGAAIIAQDAATCVVFGMPREPIEKGIVDVVAPLDRIAAEIARLTGQGAAPCK